MGSRLALLITLLNGLLLASATSGADPSARPAWLGVVTTEASFERLAALGLEYGVQVSEVLPGSPAAKAGLRTGDIILAIAERPVYSVQRLRWLVDTLRAAQTVSVAYFRAGQRKTVLVELDALPPRSERFAPGAPWQGSSRSYLGVGLQAMTDDLRQAFGVPRDAGVLITEVFDGSPAAEAGLLAGDIIVRMDRKQIAGVDDVYRVLDFFEPGDQVNVEIIRNKSAKTLSVTLAPPPDEGRRGWWFGRWWDSPPRIPAPFLEPHYWQRQLDELLERWQDYWQVPPYARPLEQPL